MLLGRQKLLLSLTNMAQKRSKARDHVTRAARSSQPQAEETVLVVQRSISSDGFVVYGSPIKPKHVSVEQIRAAVLALKNRN